MGGEAKPLRREATDLGNDRLRQWLLTRQGCWGEPAMLIGVGSKAAVVLCTCHLGPPELRWEMREDRRAVSRSGEGGAAETVGPSLAP